MSKPRLVSSTYVLDNGIEYQWYKKDLYDDYDIEIVNVEAGKNIWSIIGDDNKKTVMDTKPKDIPLFEQGTAMYHKLLKEDELRKVLIGDLGDDLWCLYTISENRKELIKTYFDFRGNDADEKCPERDRLYNDPSDLISDISNGNTVVFVFGSSNLYEKYFVKVSNTEFMCIEVKYHA
jgi:hypothetical protein